ncbi:hypothetical protein QUF70_20220 [Desulfobacterales bacterium HSG17]|nr:hypothetical protein [Desulfobacterales bacterium HSG17]
MNIENGGEISARGTGTGSAGNLKIDVTNTFKINNASVKTDTLKSDGGEITITAAPENMLHLKNGAITTSVKGDKGDGGNINIAEPQFIIMDNSNIIANAFEGQGGNIKITANQFISDPASKVNASSQLGIDGTVNINSPEADISSSLFVLPGNFIDASKWIKTPCSLRTGEDVSSLVQIPRDALPESPDDLVPSPILITVSPVFQNLYRREILSKLQKPAKKS